MFVLSLCTDHPADTLQPSEMPISELIQRANAIWHRKGIKPKQHLSEPCPGAETVMEKRKHADRCKSLPEELPEDMDLMIEVRMCRDGAVTTGLTQGAVQAKDKEQAVFHLYRVYNLHPVIHENLRPEKPPKPFPRATQAEQADGEDVVREGEAPATPRKRRTRAKAPKTEEEAIGA